ncbi:LAME_0F03752g1_1 [Lachancea meyersii CBS 8951]|uniref:LAME_0F03752g1_1 n=1 Tax=Lachancea meyersii CBS 8951 TaxID=1266667 RepID=A0A1G4JRF9_9SACH|nr:LAME_0F03752g1_1 [Lachancea meyersii CBS 8951]
MKDTLELERTPKHENAKRLSFSRETEESPKSPQTPSPPNNRGSRSNRRTSVSHGFLASPLPGSSAKRSSGSDFIVPESPGVKTRLLPPTTPKSRNAEVFLSPSPKLKSSGIQKDTERPIRELSNNLKTRLNYAFVKLQNGWTDKTLPQLESGTDDSPEKPLEVPKLRNTAYSNRFLEEEDSGNNSAHAALMNALGSPRKKQQQQPGSSFSSGGLLASPQKPAPPPIITKPVSVAVSPADKPKTRSEDQPSEVEAIETLMSLSSPKKASHNASQEFTLPPLPHPASSQGQPGVHSDPTIVGMSSRSSSSSSSVPNTLAKPFLLKGNTGTSAQVLLDVETDVEDVNGD